MKKSLLILAGFCFLQGNSQNVGINTTTPEASLDVNGNLRIQDVPISSAAASQNFLVLDSNNKVEQVNGNYASAVNTTIAKGEFSGTLSLLTISVNGWRNINFNGSIPIDIGNNFTSNSTGSFYTAPSTGIYEINYGVRLGSGVDLSLLTNKSIGIIRKTSTASTTILDSKRFDGISVALVLTLSISSSSINSVYQLNAGDKIYFATSSGLNVGLLTGSKASFVIKKISD